MFRAYTHARSFTSLFFKPLLCRRDEFTYVLLETRSFLIVLLPLAASLNTFQPYLARLAGQIAASVPRIFQKISHLCVARVKGQRVGGFREARCTFVPRVKARGLRSSRRSTIENQKHTSLHQTQDERLARDDPEGRRRRSGAERERERRERELRNAWEREPAPSTAICPSRIPRRREWGCRGHRPREYILPLSPTTYVFFFLLERGVVQTATPPRGRNDFEFTAKKASRDSWNRDGELLGPSVFETLLAWKEKKKKASTVEKLIETPIDHRSPQTSSLISGNKLSGYVTDRANLEFGIRIRE